MIAKPQVKYLWLSTLYTIYYDMTVILETSRLLIRHFTMADSPFIVKLMNSPGWLQYVGSPVIETLADAENFLKSGPINAYATYSFRQYLVELKAGNIPVGMCGLIKRDSPEYMDIGYALLPEFEGKGYAYEMVMATMNFAFKSLHRLQLAALTDPDNRRSVKLLEKLGFVYKKTINLGKELMLFVKEAESL